MGLAGVVTAGFLAAPSLAGAQELPFPQRSIEPGASFTLKGGGCLLDGTPGMVGVAITWPTDEAGETFDVLPLEETTQADEEGNWSVTNTFPTDPASDWNVAVPVCVDPEDPDNAKALEDGAVIYTVKRRGTPGTTPTKPIEVPTPDEVVKPVKEAVKEEVKESPKKAPTTKGPKAVKATPTFTG